MNNIVDKYKEYVNSLKDGEQPMTYYEFLNLNSHKEDNKKFYDKKNKKYLYFGIILITVNIIGVYQLIENHNMPDGITIGSLIGLFLLAIIGIFFIIKYIK